MDATRRVLVLTDLVDSTRVTSELGDARAAELWATHDDQIRRLVAAHHGLEIDKSDGFLLLFDSVPDAVAFQVAYHAALASMSLRARVGMHSGDVVLRKTPADQVERGAKPVEVDGLAKPLTARLMALAAGGQTLATPDVASLSPGARLLGHYRLKGISDPVEAWALAGGSFERPPNGDKAHRVVRSAGRWVGVDEIGRGLTAESDALVGRLDETARLDALLRSGARLLTLSGSGGVGKTRLARHFALDHLGDFSGGTYFVDLTSALDESGLVRAVAKELDVQLGADPVDQLGHALASRGPVLLVLDNFEQLISRAPHLATWLGAAPELTVLATSRQRLALRGEHVIDVDPLPLPPPADAPSLALFVNRAQQLRPDFAADGATLPILIDIVRRLDGLPLAIELAAARLRVLGITQLRDRLQKSLGVLKEDARSDRQRTLEATIDWSWQLLEPKAQIAFREASVFRGAFDVESAEAVFSGGAEDALDLLQDLVDKSLVRAEDAGDGRTRYRLLESIRAFGENKLAQSGEEKAVRDRHARWFFAVASRAIKESGGGARLGDALPNLRVALFHSRSESALAREGMPLVHQVGEWTSPEGIELIELARPFLDGAELGRLTVFEAYLQFWSGDASAALRLEERAAEIFRAAGDRRGVADALVQRASHLWAIQDPGWETALDDAIRAAEMTEDESRAVRARAERAIIEAHHSRPDSEGPIRAWVAHAERAEPGQLGRALVALGICLQFLGRDREAGDAFERALEFGRSRGHQVVELTALGNLGDVLIGLDPARAVTTLETTVQLARQRGVMREVQIFSSCLASAYLIAGRIEDFLAVPLARPTDRRFLAMQDLRVGIREALQDEPARARETIETAARELVALHETERHWIQEHALGLAFVALAEARAGMRTMDDAVAEARAQGERRVSEFVRQTIEREIARSMG